MAFQKGPGYGYNAWGKIDVLERFPKAICQREQFAVGPVYRVYKEPDSVIVIATALSARNAWCLAADRIGDGEHD